MYCEKADIEKFLNITIEDSIDFYIQSAEDLIFKLTNNRIFTANANAVDEETRLYDGNERQNLIIDDAFDITKVEVGNDFYGLTKTEIDEDYYRLLPNNYIAKKIPINEIHLLYQFFTGGMQNIAITGKFGYGSLPNDIVMACIILVSGMYNYSLGANTIKSESIGNYSVSYGDNNLQWGQFEMAKGILQKYRRYTL